MIEIYLSPNIHQKKFWEKIEKFDYDLKVFSRRELGAEDDRGLQESLNYELGLFQAEQVQHYTFINLNDSHVPSRIHFEDFVQNYAQSECYKFIFLTLKDFENVMNLNLHNIHKIFFSLCCFVLCGEEAEAMNSNFIQDENNKIGHCRYLYFPIENDQHWILIQQMIFRALEIVSFNSQNSLLKNSRFQKISEIMSEIYNVYPNRKYNDLVPAIVLTQDDHVIYKNQSFHSLMISIKEIVNAQPSSIISINGAQYHCCHSKFRGRGNYESELLKVIYLNPVVEKLSHSAMFFKKSQELGIISSSLAHELNNPLAGILSGVSLLRLERLDHDDLATIEEIYSSADRCKLLVEVFLGFSRVKISHNISMNNTSSSFLKMFEQVKLLFRSRYIETQSFVDISLGYDHDLNNLSQFHMKNHSVMVMIFYILIDSVISEYERMNLLKLHPEKRNLESPIHQEELNQDASFDLKDRLKIIIGKSEQYLSIRYLMPHSENVRIKTSNLLGHLLKIENLKIEFNPDYIFLYWLDS